jgi:hypothetical protein
MQHKFRHYLAEQRRHKRHGRAYQRRRGDVGAVWQCFQQRRHFRDRRRIDDLRYRHWDWRNFCRQWGDTGTDGYG